MATVIITNQPNYTNDYSTQMGNSADYLEITNSTVTQSAATGAKADIAEISGGAGQTNMNGTNDAGMSIAMGLGSDTVNITGDVNTVGGISGGRHADLININTTGTIGGVITGGESSDTINIQGGTFAGGVESGLGNDNITISGFTGNLVIDGNEDADLLDVDTLDLSAFSASEVNLTYDASNSENGTAVFTDGRVINFSNIENLLPPTPVVCFCEDTSITTDQGEISIQDLKIGDLVQTLDHGLQPIRFIYKRRLLATSTTKPVIFEPNSVGNPIRLRVSQRHRMYTRNLPLPIFSVFSNHLVEAINLCNGGSIRVDQDCEWVTYYHLMFDRHEIIRASGVYSESWQPSKRNLKRNKALAAELLEIFPEIHQANAKVSREMVHIKRYRAYQN